MLCPSSERGTLPDSPRHSYATLSYATRASVSPKVIRCHNPDDEPTIHHRATIVVTAFTSKLGERGMIAVYRATDTKVKGEPAMNSAARCHGPATQATSRKPGEL